MNPAALAHMQNAGIENQIKRLNLNALIKEQSGLNAFSNALRGVNQPNSAQGIADAAGEVPTSANSASAPTPTNTAPSPVPQPTMGGDGTVNFMGVPLSPQQIRILQNMPEREAMETFKTYAKEKLKDSRTDQQKNYMYARQNPDFEQYQLRQKQAASYVDPSIEARSVFNKEQMKDLADFTKLSGNFDDSIRSLDVMNMIVEDNPDLQGPITGRVLEMFPEATTPSATFQSLASDAARKLYVPGTGQQSNYELQNFQATLPKLKNMPNGNKAIISILRNKAQINQETVSVANEFAAGKIDLEELIRRKSELGKRSLITPELKQLLGKDATILGEITRRKQPSLSDQIQDLQKQIDELEGK